LLLQTTTVAVFLCGITCATNHRHKRYVAVLSGGFLLDIKGSDFRGLFVIYLFQRDFPAFDELRYPT